MTLNFYQRALLDRASDNLDRANSALKKDSRELDFEECFKAFLIINKAEKQVTELLDCLAAYETGNLP